jgi:hypothetical protein
MRDRDLADSPLASFSPDMAGAVDSVSDQLREAVAPFLQSRDRPRCFAAIDAVLAEAGLAQDTPAKQAVHSVGSDKMQVVFETLRAVYGDTRLPADVRRRAVAAAIGANDPYFPASYQYYADQFAVTRACVQANARDVQKRLGLRARRDKSDDARMKSQARASGPREHRVPGCAVERKTLRSVFSFFPGL